VLLAQQWHGEKLFTINCGIFVPKPRGCPDQRLEFSLDVLDRSASVRVNPPGSTPRVTQISRSAEHDLPRPSLWRHRERGSLGAGGSPASL